MFSPTQTIGLYGEYWVQHQLELLGYNVHLKPNFREPGCDMLVEGMPVEVKISCVSAKWKKLQSGIYHGFPRWQWKVEKVDTADRVLILVAQDANDFLYPFVMPGVLMAHRQMFEINSHPAKYKGILAQFMNNWSVVDYMLKKRYQDAGQLAMVGV